MDKKLTDLNRPTHCPRCNVAYNYKSLGVYECPKCGLTEKDDYARIRDFLEKNGPSSAVMISNATGIPVSRINELLRDGRLEIPNESPLFIKCENCRTDIRFGRFCPACAAKLSNRIQGMYSGAVGETPVRGTEKMRYFGQNNDNKRR